MTALRFAPCIVYATASVTALNYSTLEIGPLATLVCIANTIPFSALFIWAVVKA